MGTYELKIASCGMISGVLHEGDSDLKAESLDLASVCLIPGRIGSFDFETI